MTRYRLYYRTTASAYVEVDADSPEEAADKAWDEAEFPSLCAQCSGWGREYSLDLGEWEPEEGDDAIVAVGGAE